MLDARMHIRMQVLGSGVQLRSEIYMSVKLIENCKGKV